jgi:hypothetical protein
MHIDDVGDTSEAVQRTEGKPSLPTTLQSNEEQHRYGEQHDLVHTGLGDLEEVELTVHPCIKGGGFYDQRDSHADERNASNNTGES